MIQIIKTLYPTYYYGGLINIPTNYDDSFEVHNTLVNVYFGDWDINGIVAKIDRNANTGHPRIRSTGNNKIFWIDWIHNNHELMGNITVSFNNPLRQNSILIQ